MPSLTKVAIALAAGAIIVAGALSVSQKNSGSSPSKISALDSAIKDAVAKNLTEDDDSDGLKNWEESLYKTDPNNPDTDSDGMSDGDEVTAGRDPFVAGKGSNFVTPKDLMPYASTTLPTLNATERFSRDIFLKYLEAKNSGQTIDETSANTIADSVIHGDYSPQRKEFVTPKSLILPNASASDLKLYGNKLGEIVSVPLPEGTPNETDIMTKIISDGIEASDKTTLGVIQKRYETMRKKLSAIVVPKQLVKAHELFIQGLDRMIDGVKGAANFENDPVGSYVMINGYGEGLDMLTSSALALKSELLKAGVKFSPQEPGASLLE
jgi:hypothetical protein